MITRVSSALIFTTLTLIYMSGQKAVMYLHGGYVNY